MAHRFVLPALVGLGLVLGASAPAFAERGGGHGGWHGGGGGWHGGGWHRGGGWHGGGGWRGGYYARGWGYRPYSGPRVVVGGGYPYYYPYAYPYPYYAPGVTLSIP